MSVTMRNGRATVRRVDQAQGQIKRQLEAALIQVWIMEEPCDLLLRFWCNRHHDFCWQPLEVKTARKGGKIAKRVDQPVQDAFLRITNTPAVSSFEQAWGALNRLHRLEAPHINVQLPVNPPT